MTQLAVSRFGSNSSGSKLFVLTSKQNRLGNKLIHRSHVQEVLGEPNAMLWTTQPTLGGRAGAWVSGMIR